MNSQPTILFQPPNHVGLGHVNRLAAIALALQRIDPSIRSVFAVEGAAHLLLDAIGMPCIPLTSSHAMEETNLWSSWTKLERLTLATEIARSIIKTVEPHIIVFDCFPAPALFSTALDAKVPIVLCLREMKDLEAYLVHIANLLPHLSLVLIPHDNDHFELPDVLKGRGHFVGQITRPAKTSADRTRGPDHSQILITGGGGGYPDTVRFYNMAISALSQLRSQIPSLQGCLITGPLFKDWLRLEAASGCVVMPFEADTIGAFAAADLVLSVAGYNSVEELQQVGTKTILLPAERLWDDQFARARRAARASSQFRVYLGSNPAELAEIARGFLRETPTTLCAKSSEGADKAAQYLRSILKLT